MPPLLVSLQMEEKGNTLSDMFSPLAFAIATPASDSISWQDQI